MNKETRQGIRLGIFVLAGTLFLIAALYLIGNKRNLFGNTFTVRAEFHDVNGLVPGNNVRFSGIDVGTVESVEAISGSKVTVTMIIEEKYKAFIRKNAVAAIGTDGLMGNKLVNIHSTEDSGPWIKDGDVLATLQPVETDEMIRTLDKTNDNLKEITDNMKMITQKINNSNSLWSLLADTIVADNVRQAIVSIRLTGEHTAILSGDLSQISSDIRAGKGPVGALITDTTMTGQIRHSIVTIKLISDQLAVVTGDVGVLTSQARSGEGAVGTLVMDTAFAGSLDRSVQNLEAGTAGFNENMEALKHSFLLKGYFRKQEKKNQNVPAPK